ncbi:MAG: hypothetical protein QM398_00080 [Thermoproteota archaeon]|nr:hypothetical protein [Thermoproteota archaeon]
MNREAMLRLLDAKIALAETELEILRLDVEHEWKMRFAVLIAQELYLRSSWLECKGCKKGDLIAEACLESRTKTGKCIFEVDIEQLDKLPWPARREAEK